MQHGLLEEWSYWMRAEGASDRTVRTRTVNISLLCAHAGSNDPVSLTTMDVIRWLAECNKQWTRCTYASSARQWHKWLQARGYREDNPMADVPKPKEPKSRARPAPSAVIREVLGTAGPRARVYITLGTFQGLRVHEIAKVAGEDFVDGWQLVNGKGGVEAQIPIHPAVEQLRRGFPRYGLWFPGGTDGHVDPDAVTKAVGLAFRKAGHHVTAHQLRHWYGTHSQRVGKNSRITQQLLRHADLRYTQIYTEIADLEAIEVVRRLAV